MPRDVASASGNGRPDSESRDVSGWRDVVWQVSVFGIEASQWCDASTTATWARCEPLSLGGRGVGESGQRLAQARVSCLPALSSFGLADSSVATGNAASAAHRASEAKAKTATGKRMVRPERGFVLSGRATAAFPTDRA
jgi:hypothetical protein